MTHALRSPLASLSSLACLAALAAACVQSEPDPGGADAAAGAAVSACWVETGHIAVPGLGEFTASGILVRHPDGDLVLIDGGASTAFHEEIQVYEGEDRAFMETVVGLLAPKVSLPEALAALGHDAGELDRFVATHVHIDHVGGVMDLPDLPVLMPQPEIDLLRRGLDEILFEVVPAHAERLAPIARPLPFTGGPVAGFEESADLFGDGSVLLVPMPGHTPGSLGALVALADGRRILHVGDAVSTVQQIAEDVGKSPPMDRTDSDPAAALEIVHRLHALAAEDPDLAILPAHDREAWRVVFGEPGACAGE